MTSSLSIHIFSFPLESRACGPFPPGLNSSIHRTGCTRVDEAGGQSCSILEALP